MHQAAPAAVAAAEGGGEGQDVPQVDVFELGGPPLAQQAQPPPLMDIFDLKVNTMQHIPRNARPKFIQALTVNAAAHPQKQTEATWAEFGALFKCVLAPAARGGKNNTIPD
jgi:hypothetical protein